jgi:hypothetical protein
MVERYVEIAPEALQGAAATLDVIAGYAAAYAKRTRGQLEVS